MKTLLWENSFLYQLFKGGYINLKSEDQNFCSIIYKFCVFWGMHSLTSRYFSVLISKMGNIYSVQMVNLYETVCEL